jgi:hypothetical protein
MLIGFVIASHEADGKLDRLIAALNREYVDPPIVVHHDFGQAAIDTMRFSANVRFVHPHVATGWGRWGTVEGMLRAVELLYQDGQPDWFFFLSAADYPCRAGETVRAELAQSSCDAFADVRPLEPGIEPQATLVGELNPRLSHFASPGNQDIKWRFYKGRQFWVPIIRTTPRLRLGKLTWRPRWEARNPYESFPCYYGDFWFGANARVAHLLCDPDERHLRLRRYLRNRPQVDESYVQTVLANEQGLTVCRDNRRFAEWNGGGRSPINLTLVQVDEILNSGAFFARKFGAGNEVTDAIDRNLASDTGR